MNIISDAFINALLADATYALEKNRYRNLTGSDLVDLLSTENQGVRLLEIGNVSAHASRGIYGVVCA